MFTVDCVTFYPIYILSRVHKTCITCLEWGPGFGGGGIQAEHGTKRQPVSGVNQINNQV